MSTLPRNKAKFLTRRGGKRILPFIWLTESWQTATTGFASLGSATPY